MYLGFSTENRPRTTKVGDIVHRRKWLQFRALCFFVLLFVSLIYLCYSVDRVERNGSVEWGMWE